MLYQENRTEKPKEEFDLSKSLYVPYHPRAKRLFKMLKDDFGFAVVCKKTQTLGGILLKKKAERLSNNTDETQYTLSHVKNAQ